MDPLNLLVTSDVVSRMALDLARKYIATTKEKKATGQAKPRKGDENLEYEQIIGKFVTCNEGLRQELRSLLRSIDEYCNKDNPPRPLNILIAAAPGSGKSFLVKELSSQIRQQVEFREYHVASFRNAEDLFDVFRSVQSLNLQKKLPFVLLDEVDGMVENRFLFSNLLAPIWDGKYHVGPNTHYLGRAVFFFAASTVLPLPTVKNVIGEEFDTVSYKEFSEKWQEKVREALTESQVEKLRDFVDRMDVILCIPPVSSAINDGNAAKEYWLLACLLIRKHYPMVTRVEKSAAWALIRLIAKTDSRRKAESTVFLSSPPDGNIFRFRNLPESTRNSSEQDPEISEMHGGFFDLKF